MAPELMVYQESFYSFNRSYSFQACHRYDIAFRRNVFVQQVFTLYPVQSTDLLQMQRSWSLCHRLAHQLPLIALREIFVPPRVPQKCHADTLTNLTPVERANVGFLTPAIAVEDPIQAQIVQTLENNFRPLPELPSTPIVIRNLCKELIDYPEKMFAEQLLFSLEVPMTPKFLSA